VERLLGEGVKMITDWRSWCALRCFCGKSSRPWPRKFWTPVKAFPNGIANEPMMQVRVLLGLALFEQHKLNQARQVMTEAVRLAAPER
jgi:hypothetical protein